MPVFTPDSVRPAAKTLTGGQAPAQPFAASALPQHQHGLGHQVGGSSSSSAAARPPRPSQLASHPQGGNGSFNDTALEPV